MQTTNQRKYFTATNTSKRFVLMENGKFTMKKIGNVLIDDRSFFRDLSEL